MQINMRKQNIKQLQVRVLFPNETFVHTSYGKPYTVRFLFSLLAVCGGDSGPDLRAVGKGKVTGLKVC